jgi:hypothetical protein
MIVVIKSGITIVIINRITIISTIVITIVVTIIVTIIMTVTVTATIILISTMLTLI